MLRFYVVIARFETCRAHVLDDGYRWLPLELQLGKALRQPLTRLQESVPLIFVLADLLADLTRYNENINVSVSIC